MSTISSRFQIYLLTLFLIAVPLATASCGANTGQPEVQELQRRVSDVEGRLQEPTSVSNSESRPAAMDAQIAATIAGITVIDAIGLHGIDDAINKDEKIESRQLSAVRRGLTVAKAMPWPDPLKQDAEAVAKSLAELSRAMAANDLTAAKGAAQDAHERGHDFSNKVYSWLAGAENTDSAGTY